MFEFGDTIRALDAMKRDGVIAEYAIGGAMAFVIWDEPTATQDLDVAVIIPGPTHALDPLRPVFDWLAAADIALDGEHAIIGGVPVQFLPTWHALIEEAVREAATVAVDDLQIRVMRPAYLIAGWQIDPSADTFRRRERAERLYEAGLTTREEVAALLQRFRS